MNVVPVANSGPPVVPAYQCKVSPEVTVALSVTVPGPQREPPVVPVTCGLVTVTKADVLKTESVPHTCFNLKYVV